MFDFNLKESRIMEQLPMFGILGVFLISALPIGSSQIKVYLTMASMFGIFGFMFASAPIAQTIAAKYIPIKARIRPWNIERTFLCKKPAGTISSSYNDILKVYTTQFELGYRVWLPKVGKIDEIQLIHRRPFDNRNLGSEAYIVFMGTEIKHDRVILAEFWVPRNDKLILINHMRRIAKFEMVAGGEDYWIVMENRMKSGNPHSLEMILN